MHLYAILYVGVNRAYMGTRRQRMMLFARKRLLEHLRVRPGVLLDQKEARIGKFGTGMNLFISQMKSIYNSEFASASPRPAARVTADWVIPIDETSIPAFDGNMDYNYDVDGKGLSLFVADSAKLFEEQKVATLAFGSWLCRSRTPPS